MIDPNSTDLDPALITNIGVRGYFLIEPWYGVANDRLYEFRGIVYQDKEKEHPPAHQLWDTLVAGRKVWIECTGSFRVPDDKLYWAALEPLKWLESLAEACDE